MSSTFVPVSRITLHAIDVVAESPHNAIGFFETDLDVGNITQHYRRVVLGCQDLFADLLGRAELVERSNHVAPFVFPEIACRSVLVLIAEDATNVVDGQLSGRQSLWIDDDLQFVFEATQHVRVGNAGDAFESCFDRVFGEPTHPRHVQVGRQQRCEIRVIFCSQRGDETAAVRGSLWPAPAQVARVATDVRPRKLGSLRPSAAKHSG